MSISFIVKLVFYFLKELVLVAIMQIFQILALNAFKNITAWIKSKLPSSQLATN